MSKGEEHTAEFYNLYAPEYSPYYNRVLLEFIKAYPSAKGKLLDVGCGNGSALDYFKKNTKLREFTGIDISSQYLRKAQARGFQVHKISIFDSNLPRIVGHDYDYIFCSQLLHHLIGSSRNASRANVRKAIQISMQLLRPGGYLLLNELVFTPRLAMDIVFWVKRIVTLFTASRLSSFTSWHNLGAPVVSFLEPRELKVMIESVSGARIILWKRRKMEVTRLMRLGLIHTCGSINCVVKKTK